MNRIKELRKSKNGGMTQQELAEAVSIPKRTIQRLENNESQIKPDKAQILADYFGVDVPYLLGYDVGITPVKDLAGDYLPPLELQHRLGHSTLSMTMDTYSHLSKENAKKATSFYEQALKSI